MIVVIELGLTSTHSGPPAKRTFTFFDARFPAVHGIPTNSSPIVLSNELQPLRDRCHTLISTAWRTFRWTCCPNPPPSDHDDPQPSCGT